MLAAKRCFNSVLSYGCEYLCLYNISYFLKHLKKLPEIQFWLCHYGVFSVNEGDINQKYLSKRLRYQNKVTDLNVVLI